MIQKRRHHLVPLNHITPDLVFSHNLNVIAVRPWPIGYTRSMVRYRVEGGPGSFEQNEICYLFADVDKDHPLAPHLSGSKKDFDMLKSVLEFLGFRVERRGFYVPLSKVPVKQMRAEHISEEEARKFVSASSWGELLKNVIEAAEREICREAAEESLKKSNDPIDDVDVFGVPNDYVSFDGSQS